MPRGAFILDRGPAAPATAPSLGVGRALVNDNFNLVVARATARSVTLTPRQRAQVTMRVHNQGSRNLNGYLRRSERHRQRFLRAAGISTLESMMSRRSRLGSILAIGLAPGLAIAMGVSGLTGCGRAASTPEPAAAPNASPSVPSTPGASPGRVVSATRFQARPCEGETALPADAEAILAKLESPTREHCELHVLTPGGSPVLFVRTMNTVAHDDAGNRIPTCSWEVLALPPQPVEHLGSLSMCELAVKDGCIYDLDQTPEPSARTACVGLDGRLAETGP